MDYTYYLLHVCACVQTKNLIFYLPTKVIFYFFFIDVYTVASLLLFWPWFSPNVSHTAGLCFWTEKHDTVVHREISLIKIHRSDPVVKLSSVFYDSSTLLYTSSRSSKDDREDDKEGSVHDNDKLYSNSTVTPKLTKLGCFQVLSYCIAGQNCWRVHILGICPIFLSLRLAWGHSPKGLPCPRKILKWIAALVAEIYVP